jgi:hypothetical protein
VGCGKSIGGEKLMARKIYCTIQCGIDHVSRLRKQARLERKKVTKRVCQYCGVLLSPEKRSDVKFCSEECCEKGQNHKKHVKSLEEKRNRVCKYCQSPIPVTKIATALFCSKSCCEKGNQAARKAARKARQAKRSTEMPTKRATI